jgi:hypothetical protein
MPDMPVDFLPPPSYPDDMEARTAVLEHIAKTTAATLERLEQRQDQMIDRMDRRFEAVDRRFETLNNQHRADFLWLIALQIATAGGILLAMARGFKWF